MGSTDSIAESLRAILRDGADAATRAKALATRCAELGLDGSEDAANDIELAMRTVMDDAMGTGVDDGIDLAACHALLRLSIAYASLEAQTAADEKEAALGALADDAEQADRDAIQKRPWPMAGRLPFVLLEDLLEVRACTLCAT